MQKIRYSRHSSKDADKVLDAPSEKRSLAMAAPINDSEGGDITDSTSATNSLDQQQGCYHLRTDKTGDAKTVIFRPIDLDGPGDALETVLDISQYQHERKTEVFLQVK